MEEKDVAKISSLSVQEIKRGDAPEAGVNSFLMMARGGLLIAPWWSPQRDIDLSKFWPSCNHLAGAMYSLISRMTSVPFIIEPRDPTSRTQRQLAERYQIALSEESELGLGWETLFGLWLEDLYSSDNGGFIEVVGDGNKNGPILGPALGLLHLDSHRCTRTGNPEFPVIYQDTDGKRYRLHYTRAIYGSQLPSARAEMFKVGFCFISRCIDIAQTLVDISTYKQEKLGSRPQRAILVASGGLDPEEIQSAMSIAATDMDSQGLSRYSRIPVVGNGSLENAKIDRVDLASIPDGFDEMNSTTLAIFTIALAAAVPPRWLWPATTVGATKADAMYQHVSGLTGGPGATLKQIATLLGGTGTGPYHLSGKFLPPTLRIRFDFQDDEQDRVQAEIRQMRSEYRERDMRNGVTDARIARQQAVDAGDMSDAQFNELELRDGRLPDGSSVETLFYTDDPTMRKFMGPAIPIDSPDSVPTIDKRLARARSAIATSTSSREIKSAHTAELALTFIRNKITMEEVRAQIALPQPRESSPSPQEESPSSDDDESEPVTKARGNILSAVRANIRGLFSGELDEFTVYMDIANSIERNYRTAWAEGAARCGISMDELSDRERDALALKIQDHQSYIDNLIDDALSAIEAGDSVTSFLTRAELWERRYDEVIQTAQAMACSDQKLEWVLGPTEHCFVAGTPVLTSRGEQPIETVGIGDYVLTRDGYKKVVATHVHEHNGNIGSVSANGRSVVCTSDHRFFTQRGWVQAQNLKSNDTVFCHDIDNTQVFYSQIPTNGKLVTVYNLTVQDKPEFFAAGMLVHNCSSCLALSGKVKRGSYWDEHGIIPQVAGAPYLECRGYRCQCELIPTDKPLSRGPLPALP